MTEQETGHLLNELIRWAIFATIDVERGTPAGPASWELDKVLQQCLNYFNLNNSEIRCVPARGITYPCFTTKEGDLL